MSEGDAPPPRRPRRRRVAVVNVNPDPRTLEGCTAIAALVRELRPDLDAPIVPWRAVLAGDLRRLRPSGVVLGPNDTPFPAYPPQLDAFLGWVRRRRGPTLGICGGHQVLALAHGAPIGPVFDVPAATERYAGMPKVEGATHVLRFGDPDPLFEGLGDGATFAASHVDEVKELPPGFHLLAIGKPCAIQAIRADRRPLWGVQFHPEKPASGEAGRRLVANFLRVAAPPAPTAEPDEDATESRER